MRRLIYYLIAIIRANIFFSAGDRLSPILSVNSCDSHNNSIWQTLLSTHLADGETEVHSGNVACQGHKQRNVRGRVWTSQPSSKTLTPLHPDTHKNKEDDCMIIKCEHPTVEKRAGPGHILINTINCQLAPLPDTAFAAVMWSISFEKGVTSSRWASFSSPPTSPLAAGFFYYKSYHHLIHKYIYLQHISFTNNHIFI